MPLLVIGGTGLLGRALVADAGPDVMATHHEQPPAGPAGWHPLDLTDGGRVAADLVRRLAPQAVINAAAVTSGPGLSAITAVAPGTIAAACADVGARFVHLSSDVVFAGDRADPYTESDPPAPVHDYGRAKADAEEAVARADPGAVIVRTSLLWSATDCPQLRLVQDPDVVFFTDEVRCPLRVDRLATACVELAANRAVTGPLHVAGADAVDRHTLACTLAPLAGREPEALHGAPSDPRTVRPRHLHLDSSLARSILAAPLPGVSRDADPTG